MTTYETPFERGMLALQAAGLPVIGHRDGRARTRCPVHNGSAPDSLAIGIGHDKQLLLHCFNGCTFDDIRDALALTTADCRAEERHSTGRMVRIASYPYTDADGTVLYYQDRYVPKTFRPRLPDGSKSLPRELRVLYRMPEVLDAVAAGGTVFLVEGEKDADNLAAAGACATTMPGGTGMGWQESYTETFVGVGEVVIIADRDDAGEKHARKVAASLDTRGVPHRIVQAAAGKDVTDHLAAGLGADDLIPFAPDAAESEPGPPAEGEPPPDPFEDEPVAEERDRTGWSFFDLATVLDGTYEPPQPTVGCRDDGIGLFYPGKLNSVAGESEGGKTWLALIACMTEINRGNHVVYLDFEDDAGAVVTRLLVLGAAPASLLDRFHYVRPEAAPDIADMLLLIEAAAAVQPTLVIADGVTEAMSMLGLELKDNTDIAAFSRRVLRPFVKLGAAVVTLDHVVKNGEARGRYSLGGVHKLNGLSGVMYIVEPVHPFGIGLTGRSRVRIAKDRPAQIRRHALPNGEQLHWYADLVVKSIDEDFAEAHLYPPVQRAETDRKAKEDAARFEQQKREVVSALRKARKPLTGREIEDRVSGRSADIRKALADLVDTDIVVAEDGPRNAKLHVIADRAARDPVRPSSSQTPDKGDEEEGVSAGQT